MGTRQKKSGGLSNVLVLLLVSKTNVHKKSNNLKENVMDEGALKERGLMREGAYERGGL